MFQRGRLAGGLAVVALVSVFLVTLDAHAADLLVRNTASASVSVVAHARSTHVVVHPRPDGRSQSRTLLNPWAVAEVDPLFGGGSAKQVFLVTQQRRGWVRVLLPTRPNGSTGWIPAQELGFTTSRYRVEIGLRDHRVTVTDLHGVVYRGTATVGAGDTPTPTGRYYIRARVVPRVQETPYGPAVLVLSAHSTALTTIRGGDASILIQGSDDPTALGLSVSHGNVRIDNNAMRKLARILPPGTPVDVNT